MQRIIVIGLFLFAVCCCSASNIVNARYRVTFKPLTALPTRLTEKQYWRYLPVVRQTSPSNIKSMFALFASKLSFISAGHAKVDYAKYLPPQSSIRIAKSLIRQSQRQISQSTITAATNTVRAAAPLEAAIMSVPKRIMLSILILFQIINKKVQEALKTTTAAYSTTPVTLQPPTMSFEEAKEWSIRKLKEIEVSAPVAQAFVEPVQQQIIEATLIKTTMRACYAPWAVKHMQLLLASKSAPAVERIPSITVTELALPAGAKKSYWPQRYW